MATAKKVAKATKPAASTTQADPIMENTGADPVNEAAQAAEPSAEHGIFSLELARSLPEVPADAKAEPFESDDPLHVRKFGGADGVSLYRVVHYAGGLASQRIEE